MSNAKVQMTYRNPSPFSSPLRGEGWGEGDFRIWHLDLVITYKAFSIMAIRRAFGTAPMI